MFFSEYQVHVNILFKQITRMKNEVRNIQQIVEAKPDTHPLNWKKNWQNRRDLDKSLENLINFGIKNMDHFMLFNKNFNDLMHWWFTNKDGWDETERQTAAQRKVEAERIKKEREEQAERLKKQFEEQKRLEAEKEQERLQEELRRSRARLNDLLEPKKLQDRQKSIDDVEMCDISTIYANSAPPTIGSKRRH